MLKKDLITYVAETYGARPEYLWKDYPEAFVFRHPENRKWFGVVMDVERAKLGLPAPAVDEIDADASDEPFSEDDMLPVSATAILRGAEKNKVFLIDVKTGPILGGSYLGQPGIVKAWHMNKNHWLGILLDGSAADKTVKELLDISYSMTL